MVYNADIDKTWGDEVYLKNVVLTATAREIRESRGKKRTHFKLDSNVGHVAWRDFVIMGMRDEDNSTKTYNHRVTLKGFLVTKLKEIKPLSDFRL